MSGEEGTSTVVVGIVSDLPSRPERKGKAGKGKGEAKKGGAAAAPTASAEQLREAGNELFHKGDYGGAAVKYAECLKLNESDAAALANRAECLLRVRQFHRAYLDASKSLSCDPTHVKAMYKKAMAANGLGRYAEGIKILKQLIESAPEDEAAARALAECQMLQEQAFMGKYDMGALYFGNLATSFRRCADYVGPIKITEVGGYWRGIVAAKDLKAGDLIAVSSPIAVAPLKQGAEISVMQGLMSAASRNPHDWQLILSLPTGTISTSVPDLKVFRRHLHKPDEEYPELPAQEVAARHIQGVVKTCGMRTSSSVGVWGLPSFMNHSCTPNAHRVMIGHTMFVRASKDIAAGSELTMKYFEVNMPKPDRNTISKKWGFECVCARCKLEGMGEEKCQKVGTAAASEGKAEAAGEGGAETKKKKEEEKEGSAKEAKVDDDDDQVGSVGELIAALRVKFKAEHETLGKAIEKMKKTKGREPPDANRLVELQRWFEDKLGSFGLSPQQSSWVRCSALQLYFNVSLCLSLVQQFERRHEVVNTIVSDLGVVEPASFELCKQTVIAANNAKRAYRKGSAEHGAAEAECVAAHRVRYGMELLPEHIAELIDRTNHTNETASAEFCEA